MTYNKLRQIKRLLDTRVRRQELNSGQVSQTLLADRARIVSRMKALEDNAKLVNGGE